MTNILFDVVDVAGGVEPGDSVVVWPPHVIGNSGGQVKNTRPETIRVDDGPVTVDLDPGPLWVQLQCGDRADTDPKLVRVPEPGERDEPVPLIDLLNLVMHYDPVQESESGKNAKRAETAADAAESSERQAGEYASAAKSSEKNAATSATAAGKSETNAKTSETNAAKSATSAAGSATAAKKSAARVGSAERVLEAETNAANSATDAADSATAAGKSEKNAATSATAAKSSATAAGKSETSAAGSASSAASSATDSAGSATDAGKSAAAAKTSETNAAGSATAAKNSETNAAESATSARKSETNSANSAQSSKDSATRAETSAEDVQEVVDNAADSIRAGVADDADRAEAARGQAEQFAADAGNAARTEVDKIKGDAPEAFDTLGEIADELASNESERAALTNQIAGKADKGHTHAWGTITGRPDVPVTEVGYRIREADDLPTDYPAGVSFAMSAGKQGWTEALSADDENYLPSSFVLILTMRNGSCTQSATQLVFSYNSVARPVYIRKWNGSDRGWSTFRRLTDDGHTHTLSDISDAPNSHSTLATGESLVSRSAGGFFFVKPPTQEQHPADKGYVDARPAFFSGQGAPPSSIPGAVVGDWYLDESTMELHKITGV